eukprot:1440479-Amphidinium_carterae.6
MAVGHVHSFVKPQRLWQLARWLGPYSYPTPCPSCQTLLDPCSRQEPRQAYYPATELPREPTYFHAHVVNFFPDKKGMCSFRLSSSANF